MTLEQIDGIRERMCDGYCKWPNKLGHNTFLPIQIAQEELNAICRNCPLNELDESAEPKKGEWIRNDNGTYSCSVCQSWIPEEQHYYARYCLYCGAKMEATE